MPAYQELIHSSSDIKYPRIERLMNRLVRKCRISHASDNCIGCLGFTRCHRNAAGPTISIDMTRPGATEPEQARLEVI